MGNPLEDLTKVLNHLLVVILVFLGNYSMDCVKPDNDLGKCTKLGVSN